MVCLPVRPARSNGKGATINYVRKIVRISDPISHCPHFHCCKSAKLTDFWTPSCGADELYGSPLRADSRESGRQTAGRRRRCCKGSPPSFSPAKLLASECALFKRLSKGVSDPNFSGVFPVPRNWTARLVIAVTPEMSGFLRCAIRPTRLWL